MYTYVTKVNLLVPKEKIEQMLERLKTEYETLCKQTPRDIEYWTNPHKLMFVLEREGYDSGETKDGDIIINDCGIEQLDYENDNILCALVGITPPGSYMTFYGDDNSQWQIRYNHNKKWSVRGDVIFPLEDESFPTHFCPGH